MTAATAPATAQDIAVDARPGKGAVRTGWVLSGLVIAFLLFDAIPKMLKADFVIQASKAFPITPDTWPVIGTILLVFTVAYAVPRTSVFGAVLLTAYLGGAVCANVTSHMPFFGFILAPVYVAVVLWLGLFLRSTALRRLVRTGY
jgi:hypothetical protein